MDAGALQSLDQLGDAIDSVAQAPAEPSLDTFAAPLDKIVGKFDTLSKTDKPAEAVVNKTKLEQHQMTDVMTSIGNQLMMGGGTEAASLANSIGGSYFELKHARREMEDMAGRTDKASRAQTTRIQQRFFDNVRQFRDGYASWKQTSYQDWKRRDEKQKKVRKDAVAKLEEVRQELRTMLGDHADDAELQELVSSLSDVKKALLSGDLTKIEFPGGGKFNPKKSSFKSYLQAWKTAAEEKKKELDEEEKEEVAEEEAEEAEETTPSITKAAAAREGRAGVERRAATAGAVAAAVTTPVVKTAKDKTLEAIDQEWERIATAKDLEDIDQEWTRLHAEAEVRDEVSTLPEEDKPKVEALSERLERIANATKAALPSREDIEANAASLGIAQQNIVALRTEAQSLRSAAETTKDPAKPNNPVNAQAERFSKRAAELDASMQSVAETLASRREKGGTSDAAAAATSKLSAVAESAAEAATETKRSLEGREMTVEELEREKKNLAVEALANHIPPRLLEKQLAERIGGRVPTKAEFGNAVKELMATNGLQVPVGPLKKAEVVPSSAQGKPPISGEDIQKLGTADPALLVEELKKDGGTLTPEARDLVLSKWAEVREQTDPDAMRAAGRNETAIKSAMSNTAVVALNQKTQGEMEQLLRDNGATDQDFALAEAHQSYVVSSLGGSAAAESMRKQLESLRSVIAHTQNATKNQLEGFQKEIQRITKEFRPGDLPEPLAQTVHDAAQSATQAISVRTASPGASAGEILASVGAGISLAPIAAAASAAAGATAAAQAASVAAGNASLAALGQQAAQIFNQIRTNSTPRPLGGSGGPGGAVDAGRVLRPESRPAIRQQFAKTTDSINRAIAAQPHNEQLKDLSFLMGMYAPGVMNDNGELPLDAADGKIFNQWKQDAGVETVPAAPLPKEVLIEEAPSDFTQVLQQEKTRQTGQPERKIAAQRSSAAPQAATRGGGTRGEGRAGGGGGGGVALGPMPRGISPSPLGSAAGFLASQQRDAFQRSGGGEIPSLSGDTALSDSSISAFGGADAGFGQPQTPFATYAAAGPTVAPPFAGEDTGELLTTTEEATRMRGLQQQQAATAQQFTGVPVAGQAAGEAMLGEGAPAPEYAPLTTALGGTPEDEDEEGPGGEERRAIEMMAQQQQSVMVNKLQAKAQEAIQKRIKQLSEKGMKAAGKTASTTIRGVLEGTEVATSEAGIPILFLIAELNLQLIYKYFLKFLKTSGVGKGNEIGSAMKMGEIFEQSFIEDVATVCIDFAVCSNVLMMPPCCFCTFPIVLICAVFLGMLTFLGFEDTLGIAVKLF